jgi:hypothetical protein
MIGMHRRIDRGLRLKKPQLEAFELDHDDQEPPGGRFLSVDRLSALVLVGMI